MAAPPKVPNVNFGFSGMEYFLRPLEFPTEIVRLLGIKIGVGNVNIPKPFRGDILK